MNDALDDILADSDDESEEQAVIDKVLDEIGIEISGKVTTTFWDSFNFSPILEASLHVSKFQFQLSNAPSAVKDTVGVPSSSKAKDKEEVDIEAMLAQLKS